MAISAGGGGILEYLGPPASREAAPAEPAKQAAAPNPTPLPKPVVVAVGPERVAPAGPRPGRDTPGPINDPDPALLETVAGNPGVKLPRISDDGRAPFQVYAAGFDQSSRRPRVGLLLAGVGLNKADSLQAIRILPSGVTLAISPYAADPDAVLGDARLAEHEYLLSIPMEPTAFPLNDPGNRALIIQAPPKENDKRLMSVLSRISGYAGVTGALGMMRGDRFASVPALINPVLQKIADRGLLYVDPRPGAAPLPWVWQRTVDVLIDDSPDAASIDHQLAILTRTAVEKGSALGLVGTVHPVTTDRILAWANKLPERGVALAPVSALVQPPVKAEPGE